MPLTTTFAGASARSLGLFRLSAGGPVGVYDLVTPTSVNVAGTGSSASIGNGGSVEFSTATSLSLNGIFSADYNNYHIILNCNQSSNSSNDLAVRLRVSGTDSTATTDYNTQIFRGISDVVTAARATSDGFFRVAEIGQGRLGVSMQVFSPFKEELTGLTSVATSMRAGNAVFGEFLCTHELSTSYDGITVYTSNADSLTGTIAVYGLGI